MPKFFVSNKQVRDNKIEIVGNDVNHITNVLRLDVNDEINICNKDTSENYHTRIIEKDKEKIICEVLEKIIEEDDNVKITIFQGLPKADKMELIIQKCTELGVNEIIPVHMERCVVKLDSKTATKKIERWQKIAEASAKQCKRNNIPNIGPIKNIKDICNETNNYDILFVPYENENINSFREELRKAKRNNLKVGIVIGPEGGFEEKEIKELESSGSKIVTLGKRILRTETVAIAMVSAIMYEFGNLG